jgi:hypothetical protein
MSDYFERIERQLVARVEAGAPRAWRLPRPRWELLGPALAVAVVIAVAMVFLGLPRSGGRLTPSVSLPRPQLVLRIAGTPSPTAVSRTASVYAQRVHLVFPHARVRRAGSTVSVSGVRPRARGELVALAGRGGLRMYDWEASVVLAPGRTAAAGLTRQGARALLVSQGSGTASPGSIGAESRRAAERAGRGVTVVGAIGGGGYYALRGAPVLTSADVDIAAVGRDAGGQLAVELTLTGTGQRAFQRLTAGVALRGSVDSTLSRKLYQHFAIVVGDRLLSVPYVDFQQYPDGVLGDRAEIAGSFTPVQARELSVEIATGPLPATLRAQP